MPLSAAKRIVNNISEFMTIEKRAGQSILRMKVVERVAKACQLSTSTVLKIRCEAKQNGGSFSTQYSVSQEKKKM